MTVDYHSPALPAGRSIDGRKRVLMDFPAA